MTIRGALVAIESEGGGERRGVLVRLDDGRQVGWGEASPLPGYSFDTLGDCAGALARALEQPLPHRLGDVLDAIETISPELPAARFALESALLSLIARRERTRVARLIAPDAAARIEGTALLPADVEDALSAGYRCFKLKVGRTGRWPQELETARRLRDSLPPGALLRADANAAWDPQTALERIAQLARLELDFIEQPTDTAGLFELGRLPVPLAIDESVREPVDDSLLDNVDVLVLKPAVLGGALRCFDLAAGARRRGIDAIVSHLRDGAVAMSSYIELALAIGGRRPHGLGAHSNLAAMKTAR